MPTPKQRRAVQKILENPSTPLGTIMRQVGYNENSAIAPKKNLTDSKGYKEALEEFGLTEEFITTALVSDINAKPKRRYVELNLGAEILGMKKRLESNAPQVVVLNISNEVVKKYESHGTSSESNQ